MLAIREAREAAGLSLEALAKAAGVSSRTLIRIEQNPDYEPGISASHRIAQALGVTVDDLLHTPDVTPAPTGRGKSNGPGTAAKRSPRTVTRKAG